MEAAVQSARATTSHAARLKDRGLPFSREASIAKLVATDNAMKVTTDAVQVLGGYGYTRDFPVERYMREAKVMQIFEGTNQIQRMVIARSLAKGRRRAHRCGGARDGAASSCPSCCWPWSSCVSGAAKLRRPRGDGRHVHLAPGAARAPGLGRRVPPVRRDRRSAAGAAARPRTGCWSWRRR